MATNSLYDKEWQPVGSDGRPCHVRLDEPLRWKKPRRIFVNSMSDLYHDDVPFAFIAAVKGVQAATPQHTYIELTKRPKRMREFHEWIATAHGVAPDWHCWDYASTAGVAELDSACYPECGVYWPLPNVIHGYSAANQADLDAGIADLLATPSALRCLSLEPLIGPIDLRQHLHDFGCPCGWGGDSPDAKCHECGWSGSDIVVEGLCPHCSQPLDDTDVCPECKGDSRDGAGFGPNEHGRPDWVITGGESGPGARPCDVAWIHSIVDQCKVAGVPCFVKQLGDVRILSPGTGLPYYRELPHYREWFHQIKARKGGDPSEWPEDLRVRQFPEAGQ